jgi:hypothetical protein
MTTNSTDIVGALRRLCGEGRASQGDFDIVVRYARGTLQSFVPRQFDDDEALDIAVEALGKTSRAATVGQFDLACASEPTVKAFLKTTATRIALDRLQKRGDGLLPFDPDLHGGSSETTGLPVSWEELEWIVERAVTRFPKSSTLPEDWTHWRDVTVDGVGLFEVLVATGKLAAGADVGARNAARDAFYKRQERLREKLMAMVDELEQTQELDGDRAHALRVLISAMRRANQPGRSEAPSEPVPEDRP